MYHRIVLGMIRKRLRDDHCVLLENYACSLGLAHRSSYTCQVKFDCSRSTVYCPSKVHKNRGKARFLAIMELEHDQAIDALCLHFGIQFER
jgi:hypothetical protein